MKQVAPTTFDILYYLFSLEHHTIQKAYLEQFVFTVDFSARNFFIWKLQFFRMKTLEEAAHRMNTLLVKSVHPVIPDDQEAKPSENSEELESQDDSAITADESEPEDVDKKEESGEDSDSLLGKYLQGLSLSNMCQYPE